MAKRGRKPKPTMLPSLRKCRNCGPKPIMEFYLRNKDFDGTLLSHYTYVCKGCNNRMTINAALRRRLRLLTVAELAAEYEKIVGVAQTIKEIMAQKMDLQ